MTTMPVAIQGRVPLPSAPAGRAPGPGPALTMGDVVRVLKQRVFLILAIWIGITAVTAGLTWYLQKYYPLYRSATRIQVISPTPKTPMVLAETQITSELMNRYVSDQAVLMKDEIVLREALKDSGVRATNWFKRQPSDTKALEELSEDFSAIGLQNSSYLAVSFAARDGKDAAVIVNTVIEKYLAQVQLGPQTELAEELKSYQEQEDGLARELKRVLEERQRFLQEQFGTPGLTQGLNVVGETLKTMTAKVTELEQLKLQAKAIYDNLTQADPSQIAISPEMLRAIQQDPEVYQMQSNRAAMEQELEIALQQLGPNNRSVEAIRTRLEMLDKRLTETQAQKEKEIRDYQINSAHTTFLNTMQEELGLRERLVEVEAKQRDIEQGMLQFQNLEERQKLVEKQLDQVREYMNQLQLVIKDRNPVRVRRLGQANTPDERSFPKWSIMMPAGSVLGLLLGIGLAILLELVDTSIKTPRDIIRNTHVPILGTVPDLDDEEVPIDKIELAAHTAPRSMVAEAFRTVRTNLLLSAPAERQRVLLVASSRPQEGKTTIAANLAISIGQSGRRVLLIDANFHRPAIQQHFTGAKREGLSNGLIGQGRIEDLVTRTTFPNVDVLSSGPIPPNPTELLASSYLRDLLTQACDRYDQIILDGPPVLLVSDALVLAGVVDGVVLVCRAKATSRGVVQRAKEQLDRVNARIFGAVLNAAQVRRGGYFREQIRSYYDYQPEEVLLTGGTKALSAEAGASQEPDEPKA